MNTLTMEAALAQMEAEIARSEVLSTVAPIELVTVGGFVATRLFQNRTNTRDIDCLIDPEFEYVTDDILKVVKKVAETNSYIEDWLNKDVELFIRKARRGDLFEASIEQNVLLYNGTHLKVYAALHSWALERKLRRVASGQGRAYDLDDGVTILHRILQGKSHPLLFQQLQALNYNQFPPMPGDPTDVHFRLLAAAYQQKYGSQGAVEGVLDERNQRWRYLNSENKWVWHETAG